MNIFSEHIWHRLRRSLAGRLFAAAVIAHHSVPLQQPRFHLHRLLLFSPRLALHYSEFWQSGSLSYATAVAAKQIRELHPEIPPEHAPAVAKKVEENRFTPLVWICIAVAGFSLLCGAAMLITRIIQFFRVP